jgi:hypothetical protein
LDRDDVDHPKPTPVDSAGRKFAAHSLFRKMHSLFTAIAIPCSAIEQRICLEVSGGADKMNTGNRQKWLKMADFL